jgi:anti-anti-sigma factor
MNVKIDTREKFHAISIQEEALAANMTEELSRRILPILQNGVKNVVLNLKDIQTLDIAAGEALVSLQQRFYDNSASFVVCCMAKKVEESLDSEGLLELVNAAPTEAEAADIVLMEEIERDLLDEE